MKRYSLIILIALAGCGSDTEKQASTTAPAVEPPPPATTPLPATEPPPPTRGAPEEKEKEKVQGYTCGGKKLVVLQKQGRVTVNPPVVAPGQSFQVRIARAKIARVGLSGASDLPVSADAKRVGGAAVATLTMPKGAPCGNQRITVEGDVSAEATVAVKGA